MRIFVPLVVCSLAAGASPAWAHTLMVSPVPRSSSDGLKSGPCGNVAPTDSPTKFSAGETFTVEWLETTDHPGHYRIAFSLEGDEGFEDNVLLDDIPDRTCTSTPCAYQADITIPDQTCERCSLQIIQFMGTREPFSPYFSCADITIVDGPVDHPEPGDPAVTDDSGGLIGGCAVSGAGSGAGGVSTLALALLGLVLWRRSRAR